MKRNTGLNTIFTLLVSGLSLACSTTAPQPLTIIAASEPSPSYAQPQMEPEPTPQLPPEPELKKVKIVVTPKIERSIPRGSRIILTDFDGRCATEVRDALMRRLVDNTDYNVVTRDFLSQIVNESTSAYTGSFNTDTATKLGDLLAASTFVVGRVAYCGTPRGQELAQEADSEQYIIQAILQILDIRTGKVLVSSTAEGSYVPESAQLMKLVGEATHQLEPTIPDAKDAEAPDNDQEPSKDASDKTPIHYPAYKAAEDLANSFADKFFARSTWEDVTMWSSPTWSYGRSIGYVKIGRCQEAIKLLSDKAFELHRMPDTDIANYLHNYGVALLCNNEIDAAILKLRAAHRLSYDASTLTMIELASRLDEWSLGVEIDTQPEISVISNRITESCSKSIETGHNCS